MRAQATKGWGAPLVDLWRVQRDEDDARFAKHRKLDNRRLLFHGTRVPVRTYLGLDIAHIYSGHVKSVLTLLPTTQRSESS